MHTFTYSQRRTPQELESNNQDVASIAKQLVQISQQQTMESVLNSDSGTFQLMSQLSGHSGIAYPGAEEIEHFFGIIFEALNRDIFCRGLRVEEIREFCASYNLGDAHSDPLAKSCASTLVGPALLFVLPNS